MYPRILVSIDGSPIAQGGLEEAMKLARELRSTLRVLSVVDARLLLGEMSAYLPPEILLHERRVEADRLVQTAVSVARANGIEAEGIVRCDPALRVCDAIVDEAKGWRADLIVMGTHGRRGLQRVALGSDAELVLRESSVPVLLVRGAGDAAA